VRPLDVETGTRRAAVRVDGDAFVDLVYLVVFGGAAQILPQVVHGAANGDDTLLEVATAISDPYAVERLDLHGMYLSVMCQEEFAFSSLARATARDAALMLPVRRANRRSLRGLFAACASWPVTRAPDIEARAVRSDIPTLILAGQFDPITPPEYGTVIARGLPNSTAVTVRGYGHGAVGLGPCPVAIAVAFLSDPAARPDTRCAARTPFRFEVPRELRLGRPLPAPRPTDADGGALRRWRGGTIPMAPTGR
jgi:pimeloyl-ACP methyl ester carboxylesterase